MLTLMLAPAKWAMPTTATRNDMMLTPLKTVGKDSENMSSKIYKQDKLQNSRMQYELYEGFYGSKKLH